MLCDSWLIQIQIVHMVWCIGKYLFDKAIIKEIFDWKLDELSS